MMTDQSALEQLQVKIAFLEGAAAELSEVVFRQGQELATLRAQFIALHERVIRAREAEFLPPSQERPPHY